MPPLPTGKGRSEYFAGARPERAVMEEPSKAESMCGYEGNRVAPVTLDPPKIAWRNGSRPDAGYFWTRSCWARCAAPAVAEMACTALTHPAPRPAGCWSDL